MAAGSIDHRTERNVRVTSIGSPNPAGPFASVEIPAKTPLSEEVAKELKRRGFKFVGPTIVYAWMQAVGIVNDHSVDCFRRDQV